MGRITNLQHQVGQLQAKLAAQNNVIKQIESRDKKIKEAISAALNGVEGKRSGNDLLEDIQKLI